MKAPIAKTSDEKLDEATIAQLTWKPGAASNAGQAIVKHFLKDHIAYSDDVDLSFVLEEDKNVIGLTWRRMIEFKILKLTGKWRKGKSVSRRGAKVFQYQLLSEARARTLAERNKWAVNAAKGQPELFTV